jgi:hypothetical protein
MYLIPDQKHHETCKASWESPIFHHMKKIPLGCSLLEAKPFLIFPLIKINNLKKIND